MQKIYTLFSLFFFIASFSFTQTVVVTDADLTTGTYNWTADKTYFLDGYVYLEGGGRLNIEPGTVIKGKAIPTNIGEASALIITRDAQIFAEGTADNPIIFTGEFDDLSTTTDVTATDNSLWGGLLVLGRAPIGENINEPGENYPTDIIEGIPSTETRIRYGGTDANDNSGIIKYVSIRHGGAVLAGDNEINGLTLGGVGNGTVVEYVEVFANKDDGIEIFGGTVNIKHAVVAFCGDDSYDVDESWDGFIQYALSIQQAQDEEIGDNAVEYDGSEAANLGPKTVGRIYNATFIGSGNGSPDDNSRGLRLKDDGAAEFWNTIWTEFKGYAFRIQNTSVNRLIAGDTKFESNILFGYGTLYEGSGFSVDFTEVDPQLAGISRIPNMMLDPRPNAGSPALSGAATPTENGVETTSYIGAFSNDSNWADGWSAMSEYGYFGDLVTVGTIDFQANDKGLILNAPTPNPVIGNIAFFNYELPGTSKVNVRVYNLHGQLLTEKILGNQSEGNNQFTIDVQNFQSGMYIVSLQTEMGTVTQKVVVYPG